MFALPRTDYPIKLLELIELNRSLTAEVAALKAELDTQKGLVAALLKRLYGAKSEKMSPDQLTLRVSRPVRV